MPYKQEATGSSPVGATILKKGKTLENLIERLKEFNFYKQLILAGETDGRNIILETKDGVCRILPQKIREQSKSKMRKARIPIIPGLAAKIDEIQRITIFVDGKEFEFVACQ